MESNSNSLPSPTAVTTLTKEIDRVPFNIGSLEPDVMSNIIAAAKAIKSANCVLLTSGAGLGVDSGLPDFRGAEGFWRAYPPMKRLGLRFEQMSNPTWFKKDPHFAWGFWGHRFSLYNTAKPHEGYNIMLKWAKSMPYGYFVFTSNVDTQWLKAGVPEDKLEECHGSIGYLQCMTQCSGDMSKMVWSSEGMKEVVVDANTFRAKDPLPSCPNCGNLARPNVLMFGDGDWNYLRNDAQEVCKKAFRENIRSKSDAKLVVIEIGAGKAVSTVRLNSENWCKNFNGTLIRINPRDEDYPTGINGISIPLGGMRACMEIDAILKIL